MNLTKIKVQIEKGNKVQEEHGKVDATSKKKQFLRPRCEIAVKNIIHSTGCSCLMRISLLRISLLRFFKAFQKDVFLG